MTVTEQACPDLLSLPMYPELTREQIEHVASQVLSFLQSGRSTADATARSG